MNNKKWKNYTEAHLSGIWAWPALPFTIETIHGTRFLVKKIDPRGHLEGLLPDGRVQIATFEGVDINTIEPVNEPSPQPPTVDTAAKPGFDLSDEEVKSLLNHTLKPEEIGGKAPIQHDRTKELIRWFLRLAKNDANPKWTQSHAFELAYYIATNAGNRHIDLDAVKKAAWLEGAQITPAERSLAEKIGMLPKHSLPVDTGGKVLIRWVRASERLPHDQNEEYFLRYRNTEEWLKLTAFYDNEAKGFYTIETNSDMIYLPDISSLEWLEETQPPSEAGMSQEDFDRQAKAKQPDIVDCALCNSKWDINNETHCPGCGAMISKQHSRQPQGEIPEEIPKMSDELAAQSDVAALEYSKNNAGDSQYLTEADICEAHEAGQSWMYRKMQEEIAIYKNMWMIADKTMNELRLKVSFPCPEARQQIQIFDY